MMRYKRRIWFILAFISVCIMISIAHWSATRTSDELILRIELPDIPKAVAISGDGRVVIIGDEQGALTVWQETENVWRKQILFNAPCSIETIALSSDGQVVFAATRDAAIYQASLNNQTITTIKSSETGADQGLCQSKYRMIPLAISPSNQFLAFPVTPDTIGIRSMTTGELVVSLSDPHVKSANARLNQFTALGVVFLDARTIAVNYQDQFITIWDTDLGVIVSTITPEESSYHGCNIGSDRNENLIVSEAFSGLIQIWSTDGSLHSQVFVTPRPRLTRSVIIEFSMDGLWFVETGREGYDIVSGLPIVGDLDPTLRVGWVSDGVVYHTLHGHRSAVQDVAISADRTRMVSVDEDGVMILWDFQ